MRRRSRKLPIGGWTSFTTIDYPGQLAAVIFCQGCPWRCPYCHNTQLREFCKGELSWEEIKLQLEKRQGWVEAVVFSGGEPTAHACLVSAISEVKAMGFKVGLHTAGIYPDALREVISLVDWVGLDIKAPLGPKYDAVTRVRNSTCRIFESLLILRESRKPYQLRTTVDPRFLSDEDLSEINQVTTKLGLSPVVIQPVRCPEESQMQAVSAY